jgi:hypothetical protein
VHRLFRARALAVNTNDLDMIATLLDAGVNHIGVKVPLMSFRIRFSNQDYSGYWEK